KAGTAICPWAELPEDIGSFLEYCHTHLSHHHCALKDNADGFLKTTFLEIAVRNEPLLYAAYDFYRAQARAKPGDAPAEFEKMSALIRLLATNVASLFARKGSGRISDKAFIMDCDVLAERFVEADRIISKLAIDFSSTSPREPSDVADRYRSQLLHTDGLFTINLILMDLWSIALVFKYRLLTVQNRPLSGDLIELAFKTCQIFGAIEHYQSRPPGALVGAPASLGVARVFLAQGPSQIDWCRRKLVRVESEGYVHVK
ncbi:hypothetical protein LTR28_000107, partial [Elasticomyces elasticus]